MCIATKHGKESVIAPLLEKNLGVKCFVAKHIDTDVFGTFSGEVERELSPLETARSNCQISMERNECDLAISSEGTFGPHPLIGFVHSDHEIIYFIDKKNNFELHHSELSLKTNFNSKELKDLNGLKKFAQSVQFPSHGIILKGTETNDLVKDINSWSDLKENFLDMLHHNASVVAHTDMRAHRNPTRMKVIETCTLGLVNTLHKKCNQCKFPGFSVTEKRPGLPCEDCGLPTKSIREIIYTCKRCSLTQTEKYPNKKYVENPMYCNYCNP